MKRLSALLLCAALLAILLTPPALAAGQTSAAGQAVMEAYIDENGRAVCVVDGAETTLPYEGVKDIVYAGKWVVYLTAQTMEGTTALFMYSPLLSVQDSSILVSAVAGEPVYVARDDAVYFLNPENERQLMKCDATLAAHCSLVRLLPSANCRLREAMDGLNVSLADEDGEVYYSRILDAESGMLRVTQFDPQADWTNFGDFETQITAEGGLELRRRGETAWRFVTYDSVTAQAVMDGKLYCLTQDMHGVNWLLCCDPASRDNPAYLNRIGRLLQPALCAGDGHVFVIDLQGVAQAFKPGSVEIDGRWITGAQNASLALCGGKLLVYDERGGGRSLRLKADLPWNVKKSYVSLTVGSRGEDVRALQERLNELGYNTGMADGVFGGNTKNAVVYFEDAVDMPQDGVASPELQQKLFANDAPVYEEFVTLSRGGRTGVRVVAMQERLRDLGYQADAADGNFGARTQTAVALFQAENGLRPTGVATVETLRRLMSRYAAVCSSYILLRRGDSGVRVIELQERLRELDYYAGEADGKFDDQLADTVCIFCAANGLKERYEADEKLQEIIFDPATPKYEGFIELWRDDTGDQVERLQQRLAELGYFEGVVNGVYDKKTRDAVRQFQQLNGLDVDGVAGVLTQERLFSYWAVSLYAQETEEEAVDYDDYVQRSAMTGWDSQYETYTYSFDPTDSDIYYLYEGHLYSIRSAGESDEGYVSDGYDYIGSVYYGIDNWLTHEGQTVTEEQLVLMLQWMNLNAVEDLEEDQVWLAEDFMVWLKQFLFQQGYIMEQNLTEFPFVYDLETRTAIESFQRIYEIEDGKEPEEYEYGVADNETLQKIYDILAMQKLAMAEDAE
ncbi:MAG: peptidoglycan-binding protein [Clostridia bacterium]|nr:peptidoglycan-binding protein [Clostridia bacterium]